MEIGPLCSWALSAARKTSFTVTNNSSLVKGLSSIAASWSEEFRFIASIGMVPDANTTGSIMCAERNFLTNSTPETFGILLSVITRS